ncbi:hypothetical protein [Rhizobium sp. SL42]|uniref:hypothetical protein n=1 Tax=Rhizobium sp. SL42 TaxID=2806346 RepID=UPI001F2D5C6B|nr:hypothetical protein [Rhizobium sp. SL42]UJW75935.1 hypothetical protein IM739_05415 [Rhizobium sp. SL42]
MATIAENIDIIHAKAAEMDEIVIQFRAAKAEMDAAEAEIRQLRPVSEPSRAYQERLAFVALDAMGRPSLDGLPLIADLAVSAWGAPVDEVTE